MAIRCVAAQLLALFTMSVFGLSLNAFSQAPIPTPKDDKATPLQIPPVSRLLQSLQAASITGATAKVFEKIHAGEVEAAKAEADRLQPPTSHTAEPHMILTAKALPLIATEKFTEAEQLLRNATKLRSSDSDTLVVKGYTELALEKWETAIHTFDEALWFSRYRAVDPGWAPFLAAIATSHLPDATAPQVSSLLSKAIGISPAFWPAKVALARGEIAKGNRQGAIVLLREATTLNPTAAEPRILLAQALLLNADRVLNAGLIAEASSIATAVVQEEGLSKDDALMARAVHVRALLASEKTREAARSLTQGLKDFPGDAGLLALRDQVELERTAQSAANQS